MITDSTILHDCPSDVPTKSSGMARLFAAGSMWFAVSKLGRLSGVRVAALIRRRERCYSRPYVKASQWAGGRRDECGAPAAEGTPDGERVRPGAGEKSEGDAERAVIWPGRKWRRLDRYEPITLQIGRSDLVSVADSLQEDGRQRARVAPGDAN